MIRTHAIERELKSRLWNNRWKIIPPNIFSIDLADIKIFKLIQNRVNANIFNIAHTRWDASKLPFANKSFDLIFSNLAIDFAPKEAFKEVYEVLKDWWECIFHFHHPSWYLMIYIVLKIKM